MLFIYVIICSLYICYLYIYLYVVIFVFLNICTLVAQLCLTLCNPIDYVDYTHQDPLPWNSPGKNTKVGYGFLL